MHLEFCNIYFKIFHYSEVTEYHSKCGECTYFKVLRIYLLNTSCSVMVTLMYLVSLENDQ